MNEKISSAYRAFRVCAYRNKYEKALLFGGKSISYGALLSRVEFAYNTFCQMGLEEGDRVALWLPNCPDLLASFYGLSRLGVLGVLIHPACSPKEVQKQMECAGAGMLLTTAGRYELYARLIGELPESKLILCRPELDMKGRERREYLKREWNDDIAERKLLDQMMAENSYNALETPAGDAAREAVMLFGTSAFIEAKPISYLPEELAEISALFWRHKEQVGSVYVEHSFATEPGFLAAHSALSAGKTLLWSVGEAMPSVKKYHPDFLVATEEFFWDFRQNTASFGGRWSNLAGGFQLGKELTPLMEKFGSRAILECGGMGALEPSPVPLKVRQEELFFAGDFGVRLKDMEQQLSALPGIHACRVVEEGGHIRLRLIPDGKISIGQLGKSISACCRKEMNPRHLPGAVEFCTVL